MHKVKHIWILHNVKHEDIWAKQYMTTILSRNQANFSTQNVFHDIPNNC